MHSGAWNRRPLHDRCIHCLFINRTPDVGGCAPWLLPSAAARNNTRASLRGGPPESRGGSLPPPSGSACRDTGHAAAVTETVVVIAR